MSYKFHHFWAIFEPQNLWSALSKFVCNKAKEQISKRMFQKNKACQVFRKTNFSYPLIRTRACSYQGVRNVCFQKIWPALFFLKHPFRDSPFLPYLRRILWIYRIIHLMFQRKYSHEQIWFEIHNFKKFQNSNFIILRNGLENILITK